MSFYEVHTGEVSGNKDPEKRGRLMVKFTDIFEGEWPEWVDPCFPFAGNNCGFFVLPPIGAAVECEVYRGEGEDASIDTPRIRWRGALYNRVDAIPEECKENYPRVIAFKSPGRDGDGGHILVFDDTEDFPFIRLGHGTKIDAYLHFNKDGSVFLHCGRPNGDEFGLLMDATKGSVLLFGLASVEVKAKGHLKLSGATVTIQGRHVARNGEPI
jgi:hypothetical protein